MKPLRVWFTKLIFRKCVLELLPIGHSKSSYNGLWNNLFLNVLSVIVDTSRADRDSCNNSSTENQYPAFKFVLDDVCIFRGEEKAPGVSIRVTSEEMTSKFEWTFGNVPYVFGYTASGYKIQLPALQSWDGFVTETSIGTFYINRQEQRFEAVLALLNLSLLFPHIFDACPVSAKDEFRIMTFQDYDLYKGIVVSLFPKFIEKVYPRTVYFDDLPELYGAMEEARIPNVDHLKDVKFETRTIRLEPRGMVMFFKLWWVLMSVGGFIVISAGIISWSAVFIKWRHLSVKEHAPETFVESVEPSTAVDIWGDG
ncbi:LOW QUALITY PROTEIN: Crinkler (CRN) [Phytophthora megakarya]|uniref:Crinkler (CRN) n=1 Tax=Phytophthora megakarya TaxID=4795 RepID=A0A225W476_9STRA|nr:LOW QUALITY PROTEIN: Crinkler (CRN) [Phytophthora megakarya]